MLGEPSRNGEPDSLGRSGDERSFAGQVEQFKCHGGTLISSEAWWAHQGSNLGPAD